MSTLSLLFRSIGRGQVAAAAVYSPMREASFDCIGRVRPLPLHPFQVREPWTILILVDHPRRQQRQITGELRKRQRELVLLDGIVWHGRGAFQ